MEIKESAQKNKPILLAAALVFILVGAFFIFRNLPDDLQKAGDEATPTQTVTPTVSAKCTANFDTNSANWESYSPFESFTFSMKVPKDFKKTNFIKDGYDLRPPAVTGCAGYMRIYITSAAKVSNYTCDWYAKSVDGIVPSIKQVSHKVTTLGGQEACLIEDSDATYKPTAYRRSYVMFRNKNYYGVTFTATNKDVLAVFDQIAQTIKAQ